MRMWNGRTSCEDLPRKQRVSVLNLCIKHLTTKNKLRKKTKLDLVSAHIQLSAAIGSLGKTQVALNRVLAAQRQVKTVFCRKVGADTSDDDQIHLPKLASNSWSDKL